MLQEPVSGLTPFSVLVLVCLLSILISRVDIRSRIPCP